MLEEYKTEINDLKALNMMTQDIKREDSYPKGTTSEYIKNSPQKESKKWWHFGM